MSFIESLNNILINNIENAHIIMFGLLLLAGLNVPISEDIILITAGVLASTMIPEKTIHIFIWVFAGCYISDLISYAIGRLIGLRLINLWSFGGKKTHRLAVYIIRFYRKYGVSTLMFGRLIPFGVRNALFASAGISKMSFGKFCLYDFIACLISNLTVFSLGYYFGMQYPKLSAYLKTWNLAIFILFVIVAIIATVTLYKKRHRKILLNKII